ncbi:UDP-2,4-diacetamido-2,4,6-trideoxy-beta-L-altropyranose hydrolase [compost metagenome]
MSHLVVRTDVSSRIGFGHAVRSLALARSWRASGGSVSWLGYSDSDSLRTMVEAHGIAFEAVPAPHPDSMDKAVTLEHLEGHPAGTWVILDGYHFDPSYQQALRAAGHRLLLLDDTAEWSEFHADIILNQNLNAHQLVYPSGPQTLQVLGTRFALLRPEFAPFRDLPRSVPEVARRILVTMGGADPFNASLKVLKALERIQRFPLEIAVIVGSLNPNRLGLEQAVANSERLSARTKLVFSPSDMTDWMAWADVAITAGGSTCWELALMGVPSVVLITAENQRRGAEGLKTVGAALTLGDIERIDEQAIAQNITDFCLKPEARASVSRLGRALVPGDGAERLVGMMRDHAGTGDLVSQLTLREAEEEDAIALWELANDPSVRQNAFQPEPIPLAAHLDWFYRKLSSPDCRIWLFSFHGVLAAQIRYDKCDARTLELDYAVAPAWRGQGLGTRILEETWRQACIDLNAERVQGLVLPHNLASMRAFRSTGFRETGTLERSGRLCHVFEKPLS